MAYTPTTQTFLDVSQTTSDSIWTNNRKILAANNVVTTDGGAGSTYTVQVDKTTVVTAASTNITTTSTFAQYASAGNGNMFFSLPAAVSNTDKMLFFKKIDAAVTTVYLVPNGSDTFEGSAAWKSIATQYNWIAVQSDGSASWKIVNQTSGGSSAPAADTYLLYPTSDTPNLPNSRTFAAGKNVFLTDGGAGSTLTVETNPVTNVTGNTTVTATSNTVYTVDASGGNVTFTLPAASNSNKLFRVKKTDSSTNTVTVTRAGSDTIDGATTFVLTVQYQSMDFVAGTIANQWNLY